MILCGYQYAFAFLLKIVCECTIYPSDEVLIVSMVAESLYSLGNDEAHKPFFMISLQPTHRKRIIEIISESGHILMIKKRPELMSNYSIS
jgi:hypothetical protein